MSRRGCAVKGFKMRRALTTGLLAAVALMFASVPAAQADYEFVTKWGSFGAGDGQFNYPYGIAVDPLGNVYVADSHNNRIQKFTADGKFITKWGSRGTGDGQFDYPHGIATDPLGNVYVSDPSNARIQKFTPDGIYITRWGNKGTGNGQFDSPRGIATDPLGNVYVTDHNNNRIQKFTSDGIYITRWGDKGTGNGQFDKPIAIAADNAGNVYVADFYNHRIQKFWPGTNTNNPDPSLQVRITGGPNGATRKRSARFTFRSSASGVGFQCRMTGQKVGKAQKKWMRCSSPKTYKKLKHGKKTFQVRAVSGRASGKPAKRTFVVLKAKKKHR